MKRGATIRRLESETATRLLVEWRKRGRQVDFDVERVRDAGYEVILENGTIREIRDDCGHPVIVCGMDARGIEWALSAGTVKRFSMPIGSSSRS